MVDEQTQKVTSKAATVRKLAFLATATMAAGISFMANTIAVNLSPVGDLLDQVANLVPSVVNLAIAIMPAIIIFAVIGFVVGFLDDILVMIKNTIK